MKGLQPSCSAGLPIVARCCKSCSCEKSPFLSCCWLWHCTHFSSALSWLWLHGVQMQQLFTFQHQKSQGVSCCKCALSACLIVARRVEGKAQGLSLESHPEDGSEHLNLCLASHVFPAHGSVVWNDSTLNVKNGTAEHKWWSDCGWAALVEDASRADESTADLPLVRGGVERTAGDTHWWPQSSESAVFPGGGCRSLEAIAANTVYAPWEQLRLCKWFVFCCYSVHFNCFSNLECQLHRVGDTEGKSGMRKSSWKCLSLPQQSWA